MEESEKTRSLIDEAMRRFGLSTAACAIVRHNENITCKVTRGPEAFSLRIHSPVEGFNTRLLFRNYSARAYMQGEVDLLIHLRGHGFDALQEPVAGSNGRYIQTLSDGSPAMLLRWLEGRTPDKEEGLRYAVDIGKMATRLHRASEGFKGVRVRYDQALIGGLIEEIRAAARSDHLSQTAADICVGELRAIESAMDRLGGNSQSAGVIHADLGLGNILLTEKGLIPIDFSLSGYGCFAQDAGMIQSNYSNDEDRRNVLEGFRQGGEEVDETDAALFLSLSVLLFIGMQHAKHHREPWFQSAVERWCKELFTHCVQ